MWNAPLGQRQYTLGFPNREIETSLNHALLPSLGVEKASRERRTLFRHLSQHDLAGLETHLKALYAGLPTTGTAIVLLLGVSRGVQPLRRQLLQYKYAAAGRLEDRARRCIRQAQTSR